MLVRAALRARPLAAGRRAAAPRRRLQCSICSAPASAARLQSTSAEGLATAARRGPPRATRKALSTAAPEAAKEDDGYAWVPYAVLAAIGGLGFWF